MKETMAERELISWMLTGDSAAQHVFYNACRGNKIRENHHSLTWDGKDSRGSAVVPGQYEVRVVTPDGYFVKNLVIRTDLKKSGITGINMKDGG